MVPSGNSSQAAQDFYNYLHAHFLAVIPGDRTHILWTGPIWIAVFAVILVGFFFLYSMYLSRVHRKRGEMYGASSFGGSILERIGPLSMFSWVVWGLIIAWALYFIVTQILYGQIY